MDFSSLTRVQKIAVADPGPAPIKFTSTSGAPGVASALVSAIPGVGLLAAAAIGGAGGVAGAVGNASAVGNPDKGKSFTDEVEKRSIALPAQMITLFKEGLQRTGYETSVVNAEAATSGQKDEKLDCKKLKAEADALLQFTYLSVGFNSVPFSTEWFPTMSIRVRLSDCHSGENIYANIIVPSEREIRTAYSDMIKGPPLVQYSSLDALIANSTAAFDELSKRQRAVALHVLKALTAGRSSRPSALGASITTSRPAADNEVLPIRSDMAVATMPLTQPSSPVPSDSSVPYLTQEDQERFQDFLKRPFPRAFAISDTGRRRVAARACD
ncbi:hypothetical protein CS8_094090 [Cupriavidus sp. 8B]